MPLVTRHPRVVRFLTGRRDTSTRKGAHSLSNASCACPYTLALSPWSRKAVVHVLTAARALCACVVHRCSRHGAAGSRRRVGRRSAVTAVCGAAPPLRLTGCVLRVRVEGRGMGPVDPRTHHGRDGRRHRGRSWRLPALAPALPSPALSPPALARQHQCTSTCATADAHVHGRPVEVHVYIRPSGTI